MDAPADQPQVEVVSGLGPFCERALQLAASARTELSLLTYAFDARIYGGEAFVDAVRRFTLEHRRAHVRILINQPGVAMRRAHRLVELGRLLSSRIAFRELLEERKKAHYGELLIADERSFLVRPSPESLEARHFTYAPVTAREKLKAFNTLWDESVPAREMATLGI